MYTHFINKLKDHIWRAYEWKNVVDNLAKKQMWLSRIFKL